MPWFARDYTGRALSENERQFMVALADLLTRLAVPQLDENETALTAESEHCLIILLPHRALGGISIVVWLSADRAEVTWAQVADLDRSHDSLDLGVCVGQFRFDPDKPDFGPVVDCIRRQLAAPLSVQVFDSGRAVVSVTDTRGVLRPVGEIGAGLGWAGLFRRGKLTHQTTIRLVDPVPPPVTEPSGVDGWFGSSSRGA